MLDVLGLGSLALDEDGADAEAQELMLEREDAREREGLWAGG